MAPDFIGAEWVEYEFKFIFNMLIYLLQAQIDTMIICACNKYLCRYKPAIFFVNNKNFDMKWF